MAFMPIRIGIAFVRFRCDIAFVRFRCDIVFVPLCFLGASFFIGGLLRDLHCIFRVPLFSLKVFCVSPFVFLGCLFFYRRSFA
jgi:hypothetical protein